MNSERQQLTLFSADSLASPSAWLVSRKDKTTIDTFGLSFRGWSRKLDLVGFWLRTSLESSTSRLTMYVPIWSVSATKSGYGILKLRLSERTTDELASFLWRTPNATACDRGSYSENAMKIRLKRGKQIRLEDQVNHPKLFSTPSAADAKGTTGGGQGRSLRTDVHLYPTPRTCAGKRSSGMNRTEYYRMWATPKAGDAVIGATARASGRPLEKTTHLASQVHLFLTPRASDVMCGALRDPEKVNPKRCRLEDHVAMFPTPTLHGNHNKKGSSKKSGDGLATVAGGALSPDWVEWLMGLPPGWTEIGGEQSPTSPASPEECRIESKG